MNADMLSMFHIHNWHYPHIQNRHLVLMVKTLINIVVKNKSVSSPHRGKVGCPL
jgi:hypothetical protein